MINKDSLKPGDTIWQVDINGSDVSLRKIEVGHFVCVTGSYYVTAGNILIKVDSPHLYRTKEQALLFMYKIYSNLMQELIKIEKEQNEII